MPSHTYWTGAKFASLVAKESVKGTALVSKHSFIVAGWPKQILGNCSGHPLQAHRNGLDQEAR